MAALVQVGAAANCPQWGTGNVLPLTDGVCTFQCLSYFSTKKFSLLEKL